MMGDFDLLKALGSYEAEAMATSRENDMDIAPMLGGAIEMRSTSPYRNTVNDVLVARIARSVMAEFDGTPVGSGVVDPTRVQWDENSNWQLPSISGRPYRRRRRPDQDAMPRRGPVRVRRPG